MNSVELIAQYFVDHVETSSYINGQLRQVQQAVLDAARCRERGELDYAVANLAIARYLINGLANILTLYPSHIWDELIVIFHAVDNELNNMAPKKS